MTAALTPKEVVARLRRQARIIADNESTTIRRLEPEKLLEWLAADIIDDLDRQVERLEALANELTDENADLRRQLDEARADLALLGPVCTPLNKSDGYVVQIERAEYNRLKAALDDAERMRQVDLDLAERHMNEKHERGRKLEAAERALAASNARAEKVERWSRLRAEDIMKLGQELGKAETRAEQWQAKAEGERWQPIKTAPKDGTWFLWCLEERQAVIRWPEYEACFEKGVWHSLPALPPPTIAPSVTDMEKANG